MFFSVAHKWARRFEWLCGLQTFRAYGTLERDLRYFSSISQMLPLVSAYSKTI